MSGTQKTLETKRRAGIQSVEIGMHVLSALADLGEPSALAAVVKQCGLSPPQTHRYLASLIQSEMVKQHSNGLYDLGPAALRLGLGALARLDIFRIADEEIGLLCQTSGSTILLAALGPSGPIIVRWHAGRPPIVTSLTLGSVLSLLHSATGHIFLAFRPANDTDALVAREASVSADFDQAQVDALKISVRKNAEARVGGTLIPGLYADAFPILDLQGHAVLVATLVTSAHRDEEAAQAAAAELKAACRRISTLIGSG